MALNDSEDYTAAAFAALVTAVRNENDFSDWLTHLLAGVSASVGGAHTLIAGRPGSWESDYLGRWMISAGMELPEVVDDYKATWAKPYAALAVAQAQQVSTRAGTAGTDLQALPADDPETPGKRAALLDILIAEGVGLADIVAIAGRTRNELATEWAQAASARITAATAQITGDEVTEEPELPWDDWHTTDQAFTDAAYDGTDFTFNYEFDLWALRDRYDEAVIAWDERMAAAEDQEGQE